MPAPRKLLLASMLAALLTVATASTAAATAYCIPNLAACPGGSGVAKADLEEAMGVVGQDEDGVADTVYLATGTFTETGAYEPASGLKNVGSIEPAGTDPLTVIGTGPSSVVTSSGTGNIFLMALGSASSRDVTIRNLTLRVPSSFTDNGGAAVQLQGSDRLEGVRIVSLNSDSDGVVVGDSGNVVRDVLMRGEGAGTVDSGVNVGFSGKVVVEDTRIEGGSWALSVNGETAELIARRVTEVGTRTYGAIVSAGTLRIENSVFTLDDGIGLFASAGSSDARVEADHLTLANLNGTTYPAMELKRFGGGEGDMSIGVSNSILRGFGAGYKIETILGPGIGTAGLSARYSNFQNTGTSNGSLNLTTGNIDADPLFRGDYSLPANSPSVDAGDPGTGLPTDFLGASRPVDGNGDGIAVRDQGAFEYQPPVPPTASGGGAEGSVGGGENTVGSSKDATPRKRPSPKARATGSSRGKRGSPSDPASRARPSSAGSTGGRSDPAPRLSATRASSPAPTPSGYGRPTQPGTKTRPRRSVASKPRISGGW